MKTILLLLSLGVMAPAFGQETTTLRMDAPAEKPFWKKLNAGVQGFGLSSDSSESTSSAGELTFGYSVLENFDVRIGLGQITGKISKSGGDLKEWTQFEETSGIRSKYAALDLKITVWRSPKKYHALYVTAGAGTLWTTATYDYTRYKPYNGAICVFGDCDKAVEESAAGRGAFTSRFIRASAGYEFTFGRGPVIEGYSFYAGLNSFRIQNQDSAVVGTEKRHTTIGTDMIGSLGLSIGSAIQF